MSFMNRHHETRIQIQRILEAALNLVSLNLPHDIGIPIHDDDSTTHAGTKTLHISISGILQLLTMDDAWIPAIRHLNMANNQAPSITYTPSSNLDVKD
ncbi:hypothetical protein K492DRAFT_200529 [Lichtheimia hyalospora FSU 10163]|nr:hypothetical protein K492DRAFT_200529 [Lichtheimia hyalospora FSU 10163]